VISLFGFFMLDHLNKWYVYRLYVFLEFFGSCPLARQVVILWRKEAILMSAVNFPIETTEVVGAMQIDQRLTNGCEILSQNVTEDSNGIKQLKFTISTINECR
jgi:hypothetical protein